MEPEKIFCNTREFLLKIFLNRWNLMKGVNIYTELPKLTKRTKTDFQIINIKKLIHKIYPSLILAIEKFNLSKVK
jgi:hypothetical protein